MEAVPQSNTGRDSQNGEPSLVASHGRGQHGFGVVEIAADDTGAPWKLDRGGEVPT